MIDKRFDENEFEELKKIYNHYLDKRKDIMKSTEISWQEVFGVVEVGDDQTGGGGRPSMY